MPRPRTIAAALAGGAVLSLGAVSAPAASAETVRLGAGETAVALSPATRAALRDLGVRVRASAPATAGSRGFALPILRGRLDTESGRGYADHRGTIRFQGRGGRSLALQSPRVRFGRTIDVTATVGGERVRVFTLAARRAAAGGQGQVGVITDLRVRLTTDGAAALNRAFRTRAFRTSATIGIAGTEFLPATVRSLSGSTVLDLAPAFRQALQGLGVTAAPTGAAAATATGLRFPVLSSTTATRTGFGRTGHDGGFSLSTAGRTVQVAGIGYRLDRNSVLNATVDGGLVPLLELDTDDAEFVLTPKRVRYTGVVAKLTDRSAAALNAALGTDALAAGLEVGEVRTELRTAR